MSVLAAIPTTGQGGLVSLGGRTCSKESVMSVYRVTEIIGTSSTSWEDAAAEAIRTAAGRPLDLLGLRQGQAAAEQPEPDTAAERRPRPGQSRHHAGDRHR